jgi:hypothetical protein
MSGNQQVINTCRQQVQAYSTVQIEPSLFISRRAKCVTLNKMETEGSYKYSAGPAYLSIATHAKSLHTIFQSHYLPGCQINASNISSGRSYVTKA